ncbi:MAG: M48 family metalloprotease [Limnochordia bacterium]|nr:M48 family metalloprotease [Limnochordia bacterium]
MKTIGFKRWFVSTFLVFLLLGLLVMPGQAAPLAERFERSLGRGAVSEILKQYGGEHFLPINQRMWVEEVFLRLVDVAERDDIEYTLMVLNSGELNAFSLPGGYVFITRGLVKAIGQDEAKLAAVLGHEIAHIEKKHGVNAVLRQTGLVVLLEVGVMALDLASADLLRMASASLLQLLNLGWGREAEYEADLIGQALAIKAGFDGVGAVSLLDDFFSVSSADLPMKVFRTHPDSKDRRERLEASLASFWSNPVVVGDPDLLERLNDGRNSKEDQRSDPRDRYVVSEVQEGTGLEVFDRQSEQATSARWLDGTYVRDFAWSPKGQYLAAVVDQGSDGQVWVCDRWGIVVRKVDVLASSITDLTWSPQEDQLALHVQGSRGSEVLVTYVKTDVLLPVGGESASSASLWLNSGLYLAQGSAWYHTAAPPVRPVRIPNPVPQVLQRQRILSPQVIKDGNTIRLTRPSLTIP